MDRSQDGKARRLVRTVVCAYSRDELPISWFQVFHRFEHEIAKAGLRVRVRLFPFEELPETYEVLVVPLGLEDRARSLGSAARIVLTTRETAAAAARELVRELESGGAWYAEQLSPDEPKIVTHRGMEEL